MLVGKPIESKYLSNRYEIKSIYSVGSTLESTTQPTTLEESTVITLGKYGFLQFVK
jgi:hypothetical protein